MMFVPSDAKKAATWFCPPRAMSAVAREANPFRKACGFFGITGFSMYAKSLR
jgi:hypothetical protein